MRRKVHPFFNAEKVWVEFMAQGLIQATVLGTSSMRRGLRASQAFKEKYAARHWLARS